jgi:hypothetical protein
VLLVYSSAGGTRIEARIPISPPSPATSAEVLAVGVR